MAKMMKYGVGKTLRNALASPGALTKHVGKGMKGLKMPRKRK